jgi:prolipoprotein diacylglyceryl transferase
MLNAIIWDINPVALSLGPLEIRWYGIIYALGFFIAINIIGKTFQRDGAPEEWLDKVFVYFILAVIIGSRLGHVFFYDWEYYSQHIAEIFMVWRGGLASHGGAAAMVLTAWLLTKYMTKVSFFWLTDRVFIGSAFVACLIRLGNLMNSEIYGEPTDLPWGFIFVRGDINNTIPCHPTQLYESFAYLLVFFLLYWMYWKKDAGKYNGLLTGVGFLGIFISRQIIEMIKNPQSDFEVDMTFNMGQWLSVPFILFGAFLVIRALKKGPVEYHLPTPKPQKTKK